ncbi:P-loop containing nucleoside triphosphate hydrolase protein [Mycena leptocephala]|nr:P-loop containing nucleoside triphosphate hydrolase protein [Mycena leptocephala]
MSCAQDTSFGPASTCRELDFTLYFEQTILSFSPDVIFVVFAGLRLAYLKSQTGRVRHSGLGYAFLALKVLAALLVVATTIASLVYSRHHQIYSASLSLAAPIMQIISAVLLALLVVAEHFKSITPSTLVITYAFLKGLFSAAIMRSSIQIGESDTTTILFYLVTAAYLFMALVELVGKIGVLVEKDVPAVSTTSFVSKALYIWLIPLMWSGRKKALTIADCGLIPLEMGANASTDPLRVVLTTMPKQNNYLIRASFKAFPMLFLAPVFPRILLLLASFAQPLLISRMITFISDSTQSSERGWALVGGFVCTYALIFLMTSVYWEKVFNSTVRYRGALVGNIYSKTLRLSSASGREVGGGVASTYMSVDVERVSLGLETLHELWAAVISIILAVALLYSQATWTAFLPLAITLLLVVMGGRISRGVGAAQKQWLGATDKRVKFLTSVVNNFLPMKLSRYENVLAERAAFLRDKEMVGARAFYNNISISGALTSSSWAACTLAVLGPRLFTIVATVNLMAPPLTLLGTGIPQLQAAMASMKRIEKFLLLDEQEKAPSPVDTKGDEKDSLEKHDSAPSADITLEAASFSWAADKPAFLGPLSVVLNPGHLHVCVGPVASGKTLFLLSILGESVLTGGKLTRAGTRVAYAAQDALIVPACALNPDLERMGTKDGTYLGEKGAALSGGQRQRIVVVLLPCAGHIRQGPLDSPRRSFSALDAETEKHVFQSLFGSNGLLRNKGVVLVTHNAQHLSSADHVLVLDAGAMQHQGTLDEVVASGYQFNHAMKVDKDANADVAESGAKKPEAATPAKAHVAQKEKAEPPIAKSSLGWTPYRFYMNMAGWSGSIVVLALLASTGLARLGLQIYQQQWSNHAGQRVGAWVGGYAGLVAAYLFIVGFGMWGYTLVISNTLGGTMHATELRGLLGTSPTYLTTTTPGRIINRFSQDVFMSDLEIPWNVVNVVMQGVIVVGFVVFIVIPAPWLTLTVPFLGALYYVMLSFYLKTAKQFQGLGAASKSPLYTQFSTTISGLVTIRALRIEGHFQSQNDAILDKSQVPFYYRFASVRLLRTFLAMISFIIATGLSVLAVGLRHSTNPSALGLALASLTSMASQLNSLLMNLTGLENASVALSRIHEIATLPAENDPAQSSGKDASPNSSVSKGSVEFQNLSLQYGADLPLVVNGVSFKAAAGQKIGICGRSGSGKSSLIMALFRAVDSSLMSGHVLLDGIDTQTMPLEKLRNAMSLVAQTPFIWHAPLRHNLDPYGKCSDKDIWLTLERIGMSEAVSELPDKLETVLDDGGSLSSGQRQLICLARILLRGGKIVVLDEASSSLDADTDKKIREVIRTDLAQSTVIAVAHRIETIIDFDLILVMEDGVLVESGSPASLLSRSESKFAQLASSQGLSW